MIRFLCAMKVMILHQHFKTPATGGAIRSYYLAKALVNRGVKAVVVTSSNEKKYTVADVEGIEVHYLPIAYDNSFGFFHRGKSFARFVLKSISAAKAMDGVSVCYAISTPLTTGLAAIYLKQRLRIPFIFEVGDLWPDAPIQLGVIKNYLLQKSLYALEKKIYHEAKSIVALSEPIKKSIEGKINGKQISVIPNFSDCDFYEKENKNPALQQKFSVGGKFIVSYIGATGMANGLDYFIECANASRKANLPVHFILAGDGATLGLLKSAAEKLKLTNITFSGLVDRNTVKEIMNITDAAFVCYKNIPILETGSPNKYFDALASGKLVITNFGGWIKDEIETNQCGFFVNPKQPQDFVNKISVYLADKEKLDQARQNARLLAEQKYHREKLGNQFAALFTA